jgi:hypothetical protein
MPSYERDVYGIQVVFGGEADEPLDAMNNDARRRTSEHNDM